MPSNRLPDVSVFTLTSLKYSVSNRKPAPFSISCFCSFDLPQELAWNPHFGFALSPLSAIVSVVLSRCLWFRNGCGHSEDRHLRQRLDRLLCAQRTFCPSSVRLGKQSLLPRCHAFGWLPWIHPCRRLGQQLVLRHRFPRFLPGVPGSLHPLRLLGVGLVWHDYLELAYLDLDSRGHNLTRVASPQLWYATSDVARI